MTTLNDLDILEANVHMPRVGLWWADVSVDTDSSMIGVCSLVIADTELQGTIVAGDVVFGRLEVRVLGGSGGLATVLPPKGYRNTPLRLPLVDLLSEAGEELSPSASNVGLDTILNHWARVYGPAVHELCRLAERVSMAWRAEPDGTIWFGNETWPEFDLDYELLQEYPRDNMIEIVSETGLLLPGLSLDGQHVSRVEHTIKASSTRSKVWFE